MNASLGQSAPRSTNPADVKSTRALGWLLIVLGAVLGTGSALFAGFIGHAAGQGSHPQWEGNPALVRAACRLLGVMVIFGLDALAAGIYQVRTGRRNLWLLGTMAVLLLVVPLFGLVLVIAAR